MESKKFNNFMNRKDEDRMNLKLKRELRAQLYNNRHFAKRARKMFEDKLKSQLEDNNIKIDDNDVDDDKVNSLLNKIKSSVKLSSEESALLLKGLGNFNN
jgi:HPt (histidine-containing phosphotransfer) domain-containing protein